MSEDLLIRHCSPTLAGNQDGKSFFLCLPQPEGSDERLVSAEQETGAQRASASCRSGFAKAAL